MLLEAQEQQHVRTGEAPQGAAPSFLLQGDRSFANDAIAARTCSLNSPPKDALVSVEYPPTTLDYVR